MLHEKGFDLDKEIILFIKNSPANWQSVYDSILHGALQPVLSFNKTDESSLLKR